MGRAVILKFTFRSSRGNRGNNKAQGVPFNYNESHFQQQQENKTEIIILYLEHEIMTNTPNILKVLFKHLVMKQNIVNGTKTKEYKLIVRNFSTAYHYKNNYELSNKNGCPEEHQNLER